MLRGRTKETSVNLKYVKAMAVALAAGAALWTTTARADDPNAILDLLERKGLITHEEAQEARKYYAEQQKAVVIKNDKTQVASWVDSVKWSGDFRIRWDQISVEHSFPGPVDNRE